MDFFLSLLRRSNCILCCTSGGNSLAKTTFLKLCLCCISVKSFLVNNFFPYYIVKIMLRFTPGENSLLKILFLVEFALLRKFELTTQLRLFFISQDKILLNFSKFSFLSQISKLGNFSKKIINLPLNPALVES